MENKEFGSFIEFDFKNQNFRDSNNSFLLENKLFGQVKLNSGRAGIYFAIKNYFKNVVYLPYYICPSVATFLKKKDIGIEYYHLDKDLLPNISQHEISENACILIVNYFGVFSKTLMEGVAAKFKHVIFDNSQAFFASPITNSISIYSPRKFFGVPDGCYVIGENLKFFQELKKDYSSEYLNFLFLRHERGCSYSYADRMKNEARLEDSDILIMSDVTNMILQNIDYEVIKYKRISNFLYFHLLLGNENCFDPTKYFDSSTVPMVYPLLIFKADLVEILKNNNIYAGRWWNNVLNYVDEGSIESNFSKFMIPLPIDQRYSTSDLKQIIDIVKRSL